MKKLLFLLLLSSCITVNICDCEKDNNKEIIWRDRPLYYDPMPLNPLGLYDTIWFDTILYYNQYTDSLDSKNIYVGGYDPDRVDTVYVYPDGSDWWHGQDTTTKP